jgi:hypothetical protein
VGIKFTRHGLAQIKGPQLVPSEDVVQTSALIEQILGDFLTEFQLNEATSLDFELLEIASYLGELDPINLIESEQEFDSEYIPEAQAFIWLFNNERFNHQTFWATWIYFFDEEISPFKSQDDELMLAMYASISLIFESRLTKEEREELRVKAQTPWMGAGIAATKFQFLERAFIAKKRKKLRKQQKLMGSNRSVSRLTAGSKRFRL